MTAANGRVRTAGLVLLALYVAAGIIFSSRVPVVGRFSDEREYLVLTEHLVHGPGFSMDGTRLTASRAPGYPFFLAAIEDAGGAIIAVRVAQFVLIAGAVLLLARVFPVAQRDAAVLVLTVLVIIYPLIFYTATTLYPQTLAAFLFALITSLLLRPVGWGGYVMAGLAFGYLILVVPTFLFTLGVALAVAWLLRLISFPRAALVAALAAAMVLAWTARNYAEFHEFVPIASNSGANFLIGNCENTSPTGGSGNVDRTHYEADARARGFNEFQEDKYYRHAAMVWIEQHPARAAVLYVEKTLNFFNVYNQYAPESRAEVSPWKQAVLGACYAVLLALAVWRLAALRRWPLDLTEKFLLAVFVLSAFTQAIFFTRIRLRLPYDFLLITFIALHLARYVTFLLERHTSELPPKV
jgi:hypothetical protein